MRKVNVTVFAPGSGVASMQDEINDGQVAAAVDAAVAAFTPYDSDGSVPVKEYDGDLEGAVDTALAEAGATDGNDLLVIVTDGVTANPAAVEAKLRTVGADDDFVVFVAVNNQADAATTARLTRYDDVVKGSDGKDRFDTLSPAELPGTEVPEWLA